MKISVRNKDTLLPDGITAEEKEALTIKYANVTIELPSGVRFKGEEDKPYAPLNIALGDLPAGSSDGIKEIEREIVFLPTNESVDRFDIIVKAKGNNADEVTEVFTVNVIDTFVNLC